MSKPEIINERPMLRRDARGRLVMPSEEERKARAEASIRTLRELSAEPGGDLEEYREILKAIDDNRGPGARKLFEGYY